MEEPPGYTEPKFGTTALKTRLFLHPSYQEIKSVDAKDFRIKNLFLFQFDHILENRFNIGYNDYD